MCPLTINDFPAPVSSEICELVRSLGLEPLKVTNDYDPTVYWSCFTDSDYISLLGERQDEFEHRLDNALQSQDEFVAEHSHGEFIALPNDFYQLTLPGF